MRTTLLVITKRPGNTAVMREALAPTGWSVAGVSSYEQLTDALPALSDPCAGLVDVAGFGPDVWRVCEALGARGIRFIVLADAERTDAGRQALSCGAATVLRKPIAKAALLQLLGVLASDAEG